MIASAEGRVSLYSSVEAEVSGIILLTANVSLWIPVIESS